MVYCVDKNGGLIHPIVGSILFVLYYLSLSLALLLARLYYLDFTW